MCGWYQPNSDAVLPSAKVKSSYFPLSSQLSLHFSPWFQHNRIEILSVVESIMVRLLWFSVASRCINLSHQIKLIFSSYLKCLAGTVHELLCLFWGFPSVQVCRLSLQGGRRTRNSLSTSASRIAWLRMSKPATTGLWGKSAIVPRLVRTRYSFLSSPSLMHLQQKCKTS